MGRLFDSKQFRTDLQLSGSFSGSFQGSGASLTDIPASAIGGLNLSQIASGSFSASISQNGGLSVNTDITSSGTVTSSTGSFGEISVSRYIRHTDDADTHIQFLDNKLQLHAGNLAFIQLDKDASTPYPLTINHGGNRINFRVLDKDSNLLLKTNSEEFWTGLYFAGNQKLVTNTTGIEIFGNLSASGYVSASSLNVNDIEAFRLNVTHLTSSFITASTIETSGSNIFGDESSDTHTFIGDIIARNNISSSGYISSSTLVIAPTGSFNHIITDDETIEFRNKSTGAKTGRLKFDASTGLNVQDAVGARTKIRAGRGEFLSLEAGGLGFNSIGPITGSNISSSGIFIGDGSGLTNIPSSGITGLNLSQIASGSVTASIAPDKGFQVNTNITASGNIRMQTADPNISIQRTDNDNNVSIDFIGSGGATGAQIQFSGSSNDLTFGTYDGSSVIERLRIEDGTTPNIIMTGSLIVSGAFEPRGKLGNSTSVVIGKDATASGNGISIGKDSSGNPQGVSIGVSSVSGQEGVSIGYESGLNLATGRNINIGTYAQGSGQSSIMLNSAAGFANTNTTPYSFGVYMTSTATPDFQVTNTHITASGNISGSATSTASFGTYLGDGSQLSGIVTQTNFTQSLFVTPSGDDATAAVGDMMKPFSSILGATGSANPGDTIIVYPGTYIENNNLYKDGVNYHFLDGAKVVANSPVEPMWGGGSGQSNNIGASSNFSSSISITGHGEFISTSSNAMASSIFYIRVPSGVIEFKKATKHGVNAGPYQCLAAFGQWSAQDSTGTLTIRGSLENSGSSTSYSSVAAFMEGNINTDIVVRQHGGTGTAVRLWSDNGDINGTMDVYSEGYCLFTQARTSALSYLKGRFETLTSNQGSNYALYFGPGYRGSFYVDAEIRGAIYINPGGTYEAAVHVRGYQEVSNSPGGGANVIGSGNNQLSQKIYGVSSNAAFKVTGGQTTYDGQIRLTGYNSKAFDISAGTFYWKGSCAGSTGLPTTRTDPNIVSGGELIIESQFETFSQASSVSNEYMFNLSGGTLDIQSKLRNNIASSNNGIINMTGGYLRMNGAELVHATKTGSFAYAIDLNNTAHSGSILNNCFTNLQPFNSGSFTNEIVGGGTLFESHKLY